MSEIESTSVKTLKLKVRPEAYPWLCAAAREANAVWNWANETSEKAVRKYAGAPKWLSGYDLDALSSGSSKYFNRISAESINEINHAFVQKRRAAKKVRLSWRRSGGSRRSLGWLPFKGRALRRHGNAVRYNGKTFRVFEAALLHGLKFRAGCFVEDSCGDWWLCISVDAPITDVAAPKEAVGIDLGLKCIATTSDGQIFAEQRFFRNLEQRIAQAQRRGHKGHAKRLNRLVKNKRADALHKFSRNIVNNYQNIFIGDVSSSKLAKTRMAKSVNDAGWHLLKTQLQYKGQQAGRRVEIVNEAYTTRACSNCGQLTGPKGLRQLVVRQWTCECGVTHDRDVNAARNILTVGLRCQPPSAGTSGEMT